MYSEQDVGLTMNILVSVKTSSGFTWSNRLFVSRQSNGWPFLTPGVVEIFEGHTYTRPVASPTEVGGFDDATGGLLFTANNFFFVSNRLPSTGKLL